MASAADLQPFTTTQKKDFKWPSGVPFVPKPATPPAQTKPNNFYVAKLVEPYCHCDSHLYAPTMMKYKMLADKDNLLHQELDELNYQMANLATEMLDHPCDTDDEKMETIYQTDYIKRGMKVADYRKLMDSPDIACIPVGTKMKTVGLSIGYRDPNYFRFSAFNRPEIDACTPLTFDKTPKSISDYSSDKGLRTEYQDTISKNALSVMKSTQQYKEAIPSSRRRYGDLCF